MTFWKTRKRFEDHVRALTWQSEQYSGANRRAINLIPLPVVSEGHEIAQTQTVKFHHLLVSIEGNQRTCCLKIISPKQKSRSAILIFRGRIVGCLYGKKNMAMQVMQQDAHMHALTDLATAGNILDAYQLPEELVLAAASLFHGQVLEFSQTAQPDQVMLSAAHQIASYSLPGCVVINTQDNEMVCQVYMANGRIIGVYSSHDGWVTANLETAMTYLSKVDNPQVMASILPMRSVDDVAFLGFSLTGLGDRRYQMIRQQQLDYVRNESTGESKKNTWFERPEAWYHNPAHEKTAKMYTRYERPQPRQVVSAGQRAMSFAGSVQHAHSITP